MNTKRRGQTPEFRQEALRLLESSGKRVADIEQELEITPGLLYKWQGRQRGARTEGNESTKPGGRELEAEIRRLKGENALLQEERAILKKAVKRFSPELPCKISSSLSLRLSILWPACVACWEWLAAAIRPGSCARLASTNETTRP